MKHLGDITKINGHDVPLVNVVTGGSPCQDLSVAGKRAGLDGERSGLFMEQVRIIKEMRDESISQLQLRGADVDIRFIEPRFMVWENVPGAFSSNHGEDFRCVLEEICRIADKTANVPFPKSGKWSSSGCIMGDRWSVAWRLHDAQFWGVPQRRKRIALVADFGGESAPEILFERESLPRDIEQGKQERKETAGSAGESSYQSAYTLKIRGDREIDSYGKRAGKGALMQVERSGKLGVSQDQTLITVNGDKEKVGTLDASYFKGCGERQGIEREVICIGNGQTNQAFGDKSGALNCMHDQQAVLAFDRASFNQGNIAQPLVAREPRGAYTIGSLCARDYKGVGNQYVSEGKVIVQNNRKSSE